MGNTEVKEREENTGETSGDSHIDAVNNVEREGHNQQTGGNETGGENPQENSPDVEDEVVQQQNEVSTDATSQQDTRESAPQTTDTNESDTEQHIQQEDSPEVNIPEDFKERVQQMAPHMRERFGIPSRGNGIIGGWTHTNRDGISRRIDLTRWYPGEGNRYMVEHLLEYLQGREWARERLERQLDRMEDRLGRIGRPFDRSLTLAVAGRETSHVNLFRSYRSWIHTAHQGGMDFFGENVHTLIDRGYLPANFPWREAPFTNERDERTPAAEVRGDRLVEAYAARLELAKDSFIREAQRRGFDVSNLNPATMRAWTMLSFGGIGTAQEILDELKEMNGNLDDIFTAGHPLERYQAVQRARVTAAEAEMLDKILGWN